MIDLLMGLQTYTDQLDMWLISGIALFSRLSTLVLMMPGLGSTLIPVRIRLVVALWLTVLLFPMVETPLTEKAVLLIPVVMGEAFVGLSLGFSVRVFLFALSITGTILAQAMSLSQILGIPFDGDSSGLVATVLTMAAATLFLTADFEVATLSMLIRNLEAIPLGSASDVVTGDIARNAMDLAASAFAFAVGLALPFMVLNFIYYLVLGFLNRAMPQLMVTFVGIPAITLGGLILFGLAVTGILTAWLTRTSEIFLQ